MIIGIWRNQKFNRRRTKSVFKDPFFNDGIEGGVGKHESDSDIFRYCCGVVVVEDEQALQFVEE